MLAQSVAPLAAPFGYTFCNGDAASGLVFGFYMQAMVFFASTYCGFMVAILGSVAKLIGAFGGRQSGLLVVSLSLRSVFVTIFAFVGLFCSPIIVGYAVIVVF